ncbi:MAG: tyrosine-type recombinase/integrase [Hyphomicrobium sp.]
MAKPSRITMTVVNNLAPGAEVRDGELKGFGVRRQSDGVSYFLQLRIKGRMKRLTIGRHGSPWTPELARKEAAQLKISVRAGEDPVAERKAARVKRMRLEDAAPLFLEQYGVQLKPRTLAIYTAIVRLYLKPRFGKQELGEISVADVTRAHAGWGHKPRAANHAIAVLSKMLNWSTEQGYRPEAPNPCEKIRHYKEVKRKRYLSGDEIQRLGVVLAEAEQTGSINPYVIALVRLLVLTGARLDELLTLAWSQVDFDKSCLALADSKTGPKDIRLNSAAISVLRKIQRLEHNPWVFPGHIHGSHLVDVTKPWRKIKDAAKLTNLRLHDLRHSFAATAVSAGGSLPIIGALLGHTQAQTTARYAHVANVPAQMLAEATGQKIAGLWSPAPKSQSLGQVFRPVARLRARRLKGPS